MKNMSSETFGCKNGGRSFQQLPNSSVSNMMVDEVVAVDKRSQLPLSLPPNEQYDDDEGIKCSSLLLIQD